MAREILPAVGVLINFEALFKKQSTANCTKQDCSEWTAMWQQRCEQLYRTKKHWRECILIFNDDFLHSSVSWTQTGVTALSGPDNEWNLIFVWPEIGQVRARPGWPEDHLLGWWPKVCQDGQRWPGRLDRPGRQWEARQGMRSAQCTTSKQTGIQCKLHCTVHRYWVHCTAEAQ